MTELNHAAVSQNVLSFGVAILGTGMIAQSMRTALERANSSVFLAAVGSRTLGKAQAFAKQYCDDSAAFPSPSAFGSYEEAVASNLVRGVYVGLPTGVAEAVIKMCLEKGKHVIADKPFLSTASLEKLTEIAREKGLLLMDATHFVHNSRTALIRLKLADGIIGDVQSVQANFFTGRLSSKDIRMDPKLEPLGAVGDLGWYTARAAVEYLAGDSVDDFKISECHNLHEMDGEATIQVGICLLFYTPKTHSSFFVSKVF